jgi:hypothetical protein
MKKIDIVKFPKILILQLGITNKMSLYFGKHVWGMPVVETLAYLREVLP